jgi:peptide/nickel transport system permease protein
MTGYMIRRLVQTVIIVILVTMITFGLLHLLPGGPARAILGPRATIAAVNAFDKQQGYDLPLPDQFLHYIVKLLHGHLGFSYAYNEPVSTLFAQYAPKTIYLVGVSTVLAIVLAVPLGIFQAVRRNTVSDYVMTGASFIFYSMPTFFLGLLFIEFLAVKTHVFPPEAPQGTLGQIISDPRGMVLPIVTLMLVTIASYSRYMRSSVLENVTQDYVRTARAKGVSNQGTLYRHILRNSLIPLVTLIGLSLPAILSGALITEVVFNFPGMGLLFDRAVTSEDYPIMLSVVLVTALTTVLGNLAADIGYAVLDPRVRYTS